MKTLWNWQAISTFTAHHELNLLSNVKAALGQHCKFEVVASTLLERLILAIQGCNLTTMLQRFLFAG